MMETMVTIITSWKEISTQVIHIIIVLVILDCGDFSDETHCGAKVKCEEDQFECDNGLCIQHQWVCDGQYYKLFNVVTIAFLCSFERIPFSLF